MKVKKLFCLISIFFIAAANSIAVLSQTIQNNDPFQDENFLKTSDATLWPLVRIPWDNPIIYTNPSLYKRSSIYSGDSAYAYRDFYTFLPDDKYKNLDYRKVNFDLIVFPDKIDDKKYFNDFGCKSCLLDRNGLTVVFSDKGISQFHGDFISIPGNYPSGTFFLVDGDGITAVFPSGTTSINIPKTDKVTIRSTPEKDLTLTNGLKLNSGDLSFKDGQPYVKTGYQTTISGVQIYSSDTPKGRGLDTFLFSDGNPHPDISANYVSINPTTGKMAAKAGDDWLNIYFWENNQFLKREKLDKVVIDLRYNTEAALQNRDSQGLVPSVKIRTREGSEFRVATGIVGVLLDERHKLVTPVTNQIFDFGQSSPMSITVEDKNGNTLVGTKNEPKKFLISNYNEIIAIPITAEEGLTATSGQSKVSERLDYNYNYFTLEKFNKDFPNIRLSGKLDNSAIGQISKSLNSIPPKVKDSIKGIIVYDDEEYSKVSPKNSGAWTTSDGIVRLKSSNLDLDTVYHEGAHDLTYQVKLQSDKESASMNYIRALYSQVGLTAIFTPVDEWQSIAGYVYDKDLGEKTVDENLLGFGRLAERWADGTDLPRYGCIKAYGCNNLFEDIATYAEKSNKPEFFKPLLSPDPKDANIIELQTPGGTPLYYTWAGKPVIGSWSPDQKTWMPLNELVVKEGKFKDQMPTQINQEIIKQLRQEDGNLDVLARAAKTYNTQLKNAQYDPIFRKKLDWLYKNGFVWEKDYKAIIGEKK